MAPALIFTDFESVLEPPIPVIHTAPAPVIDYVAPAPDVILAAPAPVIEYVAPATLEIVNAGVAPAPVIEYIAPSAAVFYPSFS